MSRSDARRAAWKIHGVALAAFLALYLVILRDIWAHPAGGLDLRGFATMVLLVFLLGYALVSTLLMVWVGRRAWGPVVMHTLAFVGVGVAILIDRRDADERQAELAQREAAEQRQRVGHCLQLRELRVIRGTPLRAFIEIFNGCEVAAVLDDDVSLSGFPPGGGNVILDAPGPGRGRGATTVQPDRSATFVVESVLSGREPALDAAWKWRSDVSVAAPEARMLCFASEGLETGRGGCQAIGRVSLAQR